MWDEKAIRSTVHEIFRWRQHTCAPVLVDSITLAFFCANSPEDKLSISTVANTIS